MAVLLYRVELSTCQALAGLMIAEETEGLRGLTGVKLEYQEAN